MVHQFQSVFIAGENFIWGDMMFASLTSFLYALGSNLQIIYTYIKEFNSISLFLHFFQPLKGLSFMQIIFKGKRFLFRDTFLSSAHFHTDGQVPQALRKRVALLILSQ